MKRRESHQLQKLDHLVLKKARELLKDVAQFQCSESSSSQRGYSHRHCSDEGGRVLFHRNLDGAWGCHSNGRSCASAEKCRPVRISGVAIYIKPGIQAIQTLDQPMMNVSDCEDICATKIRTSGKLIIVVAVYISPESTSENMQEFLTPSQIPMYWGAPKILCGDFNYNIKDGRKRKTLMAHIKTHFNLNPASLEDCTTRQRT